MDQSSYAQKKWCEAYAPIVSAYIMDCTSIMKLKNKAPILERLKRKRAKHSPRKREPFILWHWQTHASHDNHKKRLCTLSESFTKPSLRTVEDKSCQISVAPSCKWIWSFCALGIFLFEAQSPRGLSGWRMLSSTFSPGKRSRSCEEPKTFCASRKPGITRNFLDCVLKRTLMDI